MDSNNLQVLAQLVSALGDSSKNLDSAYEVRDYEKFKMARDEILKLSKKIDEQLK